MMFGSADKQEMRYVRNRLETLSFEVGRATAMIDRVKMVDSHEPRLAELERMVQQLIATVNSVSAVVAAMSPQVANHGVRIDAMETVMQTENRDSRALMEDMMQSNAGAVI